MRKMIGTTLAAAALVFAAGSAVAEDYEHHGARSDDWRPAHSQRRYQTANVWDTMAGPMQRVGAAQLTRSRNGVQGRIMANVPSAGDPYTLWIIVFNNPGKCVDGCNDEDLGNPEVGGVVYNGTGAISSANIQGTGIVNMDFEMDSSRFPNGLFVLFPEGAKRGLRRNNGFRAEIHLVIDQHPAIVPGSDSWIKDLTETNFPGAGPATSIAAAVFVACPDESCPESVL